MLNTKYQGSWPCGFRQEDIFFIFLPFQAYAKHETLGRVHFGPTGII